jgi:thioredoxin-related protein
MYTFYLPKKRLLMRLRTPCYSLLLSIFIMTFLSACASTQQTHSEHEKAPDVYVASDDPMGDVQSALNDAKANNKHLLIIMGASWCHDSRGLASKFATPGLAALLKEHYEVVYVDVGYFNDLRHISERFDQAHYFATPTVMIVNAQSEQLINASTMAQWGRADSIPYEQYIEYFTHYASLEKAPSIHLSNEHQRLIGSFKQAQGQRLMNAYTKLAPSMKKEDDNNEPDEEFLALWREVRSYRLQLQQDIQALYDNAHNQASTPIELPIYSSFSWE